MSCLVPDSPLLPTVISSLLRNPLRRLADSHQKRSIYSKEKAIRNFYRLSPFRQNLIQAKLLCNTIYLASKTNFYRDKISTFLYDKISIDPRYIEEIPITTKSDLLESPESFLVPTSYYKPREKIYKTSTNGSSGPSAFILYDQDAADWSSATTWFCRSLYESRFSNKTLHLASNLIDNSLPLPKLVDYFRFLSTNRYNLFISDFSELQLKAYAESISGHSFNIMHGQPSLADAIACEFLRNAPLYVPPKINFFETSGESISDIQRTRIESAFSCKVIQRYGLAEFGVIAYQTHPLSDDLMVLKHAIYPLDTGSNGSSFPVFTSLRNQYFPLINYDTEDILEMHSVKSALFLKKPTGRRHQVMNINGKTISTAIIMDVLTHKLQGVVDFQIGKNNRDLMN